MHRRNPSHLWILTFCLLVFASCSGDPAGPSLVTSDGTPTASGPRTGEVHQCLGYYALAIDRDQLTADIVRMRSGEWHFNMTGVLNSTMGVTAAMVPGESDPPNGLFVLDITLAHPFATKLQFSGFDVKGVFITPGSLMVGPLFFADVDEARLENADGYTRWWNPTEFTTPGMLGYTQGILTKSSPSALTATVNPYKLFADRLGAEDSLSWIVSEPLDSPVGRAVFAAGSTNTRRYEIRFPMTPSPQIVYGYAVDCAWNPPSPNPPGEVPDDFPMNANQPEAYRLVVQPTADTLYYDSEAGVGGGVLRLQINVHDWQGQAVGDVEPEVSAVRVYAPGMMSGGVDAPFLNKTADKARYAVDLSGTAVPSQAGLTLLICRVESSDGSTYKQASAPAPNDPLSAFQVIVLDIPDPECTTDTNNDFPEAVAIELNSSTVDQVCLPDDQSDFFSFEIPLGYEISGEIRLFCDAEPTTLGLYNESQALLAEESISGGAATIVLDGLGIMPGIHYIKVMTSNATQVAPYLLEIESELADVIPSNPVEVTPSTLFMEASHVWVHDHYMYLMGDGLWVYDIADPTNPVQILCDLSFHAKMGACFRYPYCYYVAYVAIDDFRIDMIDFSDPSAPIIREDLLYYTGQLSGLFMNSTHLYVASNVTPTSTIYIYDYATDPEAPAFLNSFASPYAPRHMDMVDPEGPKTRLVVISWHAVLSYDVEDPGSVTSAGSYTFPSGAPRGVAVSGNYIYVAHDPTGGGDGWLYALEQTSVPDITYHTSVDLPGSGSTIALDFPYAYIGDGIPGLTVCDITNPVDPAYLSTTPLASWGSVLDVLNDHVFIIVLDAGLQIMDVSTPATPQTASRLMVVNNPGEMQARGDYLLIADRGMYHKSVETIDISDPPNASVVAEYVLTDPPARLDMEGDIAVAGFPMGWEILDAADPLNLSFCSSGTTSDNIDAQGLRGDALYISYNPPGGPEVQVYDISDPFSPVYKTSLLLADRGTDFSFAGDYMYIATSTEVLIYSISDPFNPVPAGTYPASIVERTVVRGNYLYLIPNNTVEIADISDPSSPVYVGAEILPTSDPLGFITVEGQFAYVTAMDFGPYSCRVWPPDNPEAFGPVHDPHLYNSYYILAYSGFLYEASEQAGIRIFDLY